jgi:hypothetical protein
VIRLAGQRTKSAALAQAQQGRLETVGDTDGLLAKLHIF